MLLLDSDGNKIDNPTVEVQPIFNGGTTKQFFKWFQSLSSLLDGQSVGEHFRLALQALRGTDKALRQWEMDLSSPKLAETVGLSEAASEKLCYDSIIKLTIHVLKDPRAGFKQVRYMDRHLFKGKNTGVRVFMDRLDILSTYLPLFPPMKGELLKELSDSQKATILYDALPNYYIRKMKEANTEPIEMNLEELFQFALNTEEASINPGKDSEGNPRNSKEMKTETTTPRKQGGKGKHDHKKNRDRSSILKGQEIPSCDFCGWKGHTETAYRVKNKAMASAKKDTKDRSARWKKDKAEKVQTFAAAASSTQKRIVLVMMKKRKSLWKVSWHLGKLHKNTRNRRRINANVLIMILVILNTPIQSLINC
jgi:hypothetical protein